ncbi:YcnI family copper-binding membrane protein [Aeromicrobium sp. P5_D10]
MTRTIKRLSAALITIGLVAIAAPATAHVGVSSTDAAQDGFGKAVFRVPNESEKAATTKIVVTLPAETPFAFVTVGAKPGWKAKLDTQELDKPTKVGDFTVTKAVRTITWTADGDGIGVGEFDEFALSGGPFPKADSIAFNVEQTYSDGEISDWNQPTVGDKEPEHPAPVLTLGKSTDDGHGAKDDTTETVADTTDSDDQALGAWLGGGALVVALAALVVALRQNRRRA